MSSTKTFEEDPPDAPGLESMIRMTGLDKTIDIGKLTEQLKNMTDEDINEATNQIKSFMGDKIDSRNSEFIGDMLSKISNELKSSPVGTDPLKHILGISEKVSKQMEPSVANGSIDLNSLLNSSQALSKGMTDKSGKPIFSEGSNPFDMLTKMGNMTNMRGRGNNRGRGGQMRMPYMSQLQSMLGGMNLGPDMKIDKDQLDKMMKSLTQASDAASQSSSSSSSSSRGTSRGRSGSKASRSSRSRGGR